MEESQGRNLIKIKLLFDTSFVRLKRGKFYLIVLIFSILVSNQTTFALIKMYSTGKLSRSGGYLLKMNRFNVPGRALKE